MVTLAVGHNRRSRVTSLSLDVFHGGRSESQILPTRGEGILAGWGSCVCPLQQPLGCILEGLLCPFIFILNKHKVSSHLMINVLAPVKCMMWKCMRFHTLQVYDVDREDRSPTARDVWGWRPHRKGSWPFLGWLVLA